MRNTIRGSDTCGGGDYGDTHSDRFTTSRGQCVLRTADFHRIHALGAHFLSGFWWLCRGTYGFGVFRSNITYFSADAMLRHSIPVTALRYGFRKRRSTGDSCPEYTSCAPRRRRPRYQIRRIPTVLKDDPTDNMGAPPRLLKKAAGNGFDLEKQLAAGKPHVQVAERSFEEHISRPVILEPLSDLAPRPGYLLLESPIPARSNRLSTRSFPCSKTEF